MSFSAGFNIRQLKISDDEALMRSLPGMFGKAFGEAQAYCGNLFAGARVCRRVIAGEAGTRQERLDAAVAAAVAQRARPLVVCGRRQRVVPPLAANGVHSRQHLAVNDDARAGAGAENHTEDDVRAGGGAVSRFG